MTSSTHHTPPHASASNIAAAASRLPERKPFTAAFNGDQLAEAAGVLPERKPFAAAFSGDDVRSVLKQRELIKQIEQAKKGFAYLDSNSTELQIGHDVIRFNFKNFDEPTDPDTPLTHVTKAIAATLGIPLDAAKLADRQRPNLGHNILISDINVSDAANGRFAVRLIGDAKDAYHALKDRALLPVPTANVGRG